VEEQQTLRVRDEIPALERSNYLDSAGAGLPPLSVTDAMLDFVRSWSQEGEQWEEYLLDVLELRRRFAEMIGGKKEEVGVVPSVSVGLAELASSLDLSKRRKVVVSNLNFPTNAILWQRMRESGLLKRVEVLKQLKGMVPLEAWERAIDEETAVVSVDYVSWFSGYRERIREIAEIAHENGALLVVDAFHALGVFPVDIKKDGIDALVCGFYKWLCGPPGAACIYLDERYLESLKPAYIGWHGVKENVIERIQAGRDPFDVPFPFESATPSGTAARFEWGAWASVVVKGAIESLKFAEKFDPSSRFKVIKKRKEELMEGLEGLEKKILTPSHEESLGGGIVTFETKDHVKLVKGLANRRIVVSGRYGHVRVSPHFYNTGEETGELLLALRKG